jgi:ligand-binding sensor domain-containing protein
MTRFFILLNFFLLLTASLTKSQIVSEGYLKGARISSIQKEGNNIWIATYGQGIFRYSLVEDKWISFSTRDKNLENDFFYNIAASKNFVWAGSSEGLFIYDVKRNRWTKRKFALGGELGNWIRALAYDSLENVLWIGRFKNLTLLDVTRQRYSDYDLTKNNDTKTNNFISIRFDGDSLVWFGTENGVHIFNKRKKPEESSAWRYINNKQRGFNGEGDAVSVRDFCFEPSFVWFATDEFITAEKPQFNVGGIYRFNRRLNWERISKQNGLAANGVYTLERTGNYIWAALYLFDKKEKKEYGKGLALINRITGTVKQIDLNDTNINSSTISAMLFDGTYLWFGTEAGLWKIQIYNPLAGWKSRKQPVRSTILKPTG